MTSTELMRYICQMISLPLGVYLLPPAPPHPSATSRRASTTSLDSTSTCAPARSKPPPFLPPHSRASASPLLGARSSTAGRIRRRRR